MTSNELSIENIFLILRKRMWLIIWALSAVVLLAGIITSQIPKMYSATTSLNFDFSANSNPLDDRGSSMLVQDSYLTTQVGIIQSLSVAQRVVDSLTDYEQERLLAARDASNSTIDKQVQWLRRSIKSFFSSTDRNNSSDYISDRGSSETLRVNSPYSSLARAIGTDLVITPEFNSRIVEISYLSTNPKIAALLAEKFSEAYIATNLEMMTDPARKSKLWFDQQLNSVRARMEESQAKLTLYQQQEGIVSSDQRIDVETSHLRSLGDQLVAAQLKTRIAVTRKLKLKELLDRGAPLMTFEPVFDNSVVQRIKVEIRNLEGKLVESSNSLGGNHPRIKKLRSELDAARNRLSAEVQTIMDGINNASDLSKEQEKSLADAMEKQKQLVLELKSEHDAVAVLQREVESAQATYKAVLNQLNTTSMQSLIDQANVSVVDHATIPRVHATPSVMKNLMLGVFVGLLLGIGMALFMEMFIRRVHSKEDLIGELGVPLLGHLRKV